MIVLDCETDGLLDELTTIHCINLVDRLTGQRLRFNDQPEVSDTNRSGTVEMGVSFIREALALGDTIAGHNLLGFDIPAIRKLFPDFEVNPDQVLDTLIVSRLIWTDLYDIDQRAIRKAKRPKVFLDKNLSGKHALEAWGYRLGDYKGDFAGPWDTFTAEMDDYCAQDVEVTVKLVEKIEAEGYSEEAIRLEHRVAEIIRLQEQHGFAFDVPAAQRLEAELIGEKAALEDKLRDAFPPWFEAERYKGQPVVVDPKRRRSAKTDADGTIIKSDYEPGCPYCKVKLVSFEPGSRDMIANRLKTLFGWQPQEFTEGGKAKVDETTLEGLDYPEAKLLIRYLTVDKRLGQLAAGKEAWLKKVKADGRIHGRVNTNGAITGRMTHSNPNLAQVPKVKLDENGNVLSGYEGGYGLECRSLFIAPPGKVLVGVDAEGLELRELSHYMARYDNGAYAASVVDGKKSDGTDVHTVNQRAIGFRTRDEAKRWMYAYLYGAGNYKLGTIAYDDMSEEQKDAFNRKHPPGEAREKALSTLGARARRKIEENLPALGDLQKQVKSVAVSEKKVRSHDGRLLNIRAQHSALNTLLQGGGAVVMKKALVLAHDALLERGWQHGREFAWVANVHDEFQMEVLPEVAEEVGQITADAIRRSGEAFGLRCPLSGSADSGPSWSSTH